jgi:FHA domain
MSNVQNPNGSSRQESVSICPKCGRAVRPGELSCPNCGLVFATVTASDKTRVLPQATERFSGKHAPIGSIPHRQQRVALLIGADLQPLPDTPIVVLGRNDPTNTQDAPDVDLARYGANEKGVSRRHVELSWKNDLLYVKDLGSTNGTMLNNQRLISGIVRLLRDGDELVICHLPVRIRFTDY